MCLLLLGGCLIKGRRDWLGSALDPSIPRNPLPGVLYHTGRMPLLKEHIRTPETSNGKEVPRPCIVRPSMTTCPLEI